MNYKAADLLASVFMLLNSSNKKIQKFYCIRIYKVSLWLSQSQLGLSNVNGMPVSLLHLSLHVQRLYAQLRAMKFHPTKPCSTRFPSTSI